MFELLVRAVFTLLCAYVIGSLLRLLKIPGAMMLGGMIGAAFLSVTTSLAYLPTAARVVAQAIAGGFLGTSISRSDFCNLRRILRPAIIVVLGMSFSTIIIGFLITKTSPVDATTALVSAIAGGINDTPLIAQDLGADAGKVAVLQFVRLFTGIGLFPIMIRGADQGGVVVLEKRSTHVAPSASKPSVFQYAVGLSVAMLGGLLGKKLGIPAGILLFSTIFSAVVHIAFSCSSIPRRAKPTAQLLAGAYIGCMMTRKDVLEMRYLVIPALILVTVFVLNCFLSGYVLRKICGFTKRESLLSCTPAGASEMALISSELNIDASNAANIALLHVVRVLVTVTLMPQLIPYINDMF